MSKTYKEYPMDYQITLSETTHYTITVNDEVMAQILAQVGQTHTPGKTPDALAVESALHSFGPDDEYTAEWLTDEGHESGETTYDVEPLYTPAETRAMLRSLHNR